MSKNVKKTNFTRPDFWRTESYNMIINNNEIGPVAQEMYDTIYGIQTGKLDDFMGWTVPVE